MFTHKRIKVTMITKDWGKGYVKALYYKKHGTKVHVAINAKDRTITQSFKIHKELISTFMDEMGRLEKEIGSKIEIKV